MHQSTLKTFNDLTEGLTTSGDYEAHSDSEGNLVANIKAFDMTGVIYLCLPGVPDIHMYANQKTIDKYIDLFTNPIDIRTSEDSILIFNDELEVLMPMVAKENAEKFTGKLQAPIDYSDAQVFSIPLDAIATIFKASKKQDDMKIFFDMGDYLTITCGKVKRKLKEITGKPGKWTFKFDVLERMIGKATSPVVFTLKNSVTQFPGKIEYQAGLVKVEAYIMGMEE